VAIVYAVTNGWLNEVEPSNVASWADGLFTYLNDRYGALLERIESGHWEDEDITNLQAALKGYRR